MVFGFYDLTNVSFMTLPHFSLCVFTLVVLSLRVKL